jgi:hypothetical protein
VDGGRTRFRRPRILWRQTITVTGTATRIRTAGGTTIIIPIHTRMF